MRGFPRAEFLKRCTAAQALMEEARLGALLLTTEVEVRYYTGFLTRFWESPTRPWFVILPLQGDPIAVIPSIGAKLMAQTGLKDIRTWPAPDLADDGVSLLIETLIDVANARPVGMADGMESHARVPLATLNAIAAAIPIESDHDITRRLRSVKSDQEVAKVRSACEIADRAFARVAEIAGVGVPLSDVFRRFQMLCLEEGADYVSYLAGAASVGGYRDVISPATDKPLEDGDILMLDTGLVHDGYFCDFNRNYMIGQRLPDVASAHERLIDAVEAGYAAAIPGANGADLFHAMDAICGRNRAAGRLGHGMGMQLTEWPSLIPSDRTVLEPGMVLTLEPCVKLSSGKLMVHEENIVITESGASYLNSPADKEIEVIR